MRKIRSSFFLKVQTVAALASSLSLGITVILVPHKTRFLGIIWIGEILLLKEDFWVPLLFTGFEVYAQ